MTPRPTRRLAARRPHCRPAVGAVLAAACFAGCTTVGPDYARPEVKLPAVYRSEAGDAAELANAAWWEGFGDPDLDALIKAAIDANRDLLMAAHRIEQYDARLQISGAANSPQVGYGGARERVRRSEEQPDLMIPGANPDYNNIYVQATFGWEIDVWGKIKRANESARAQLLASEEARRAVMLRVVTAVATSYVQLLVLDAQLATTQDVLNNRQQWLDLVETRFRGGMSTLLALNKARAEVEELQSALPEIERQITTVENSLSNLLAAEPGPVRRGRLDRLRLPAVPGGVPSDVLARRPDVLAAEHNLVAANARIGVAKALYLPTVSLTGSLGLASDQLQWLLSQTARTGSIALGLSGVLFDGGRVEGEVRQAEAVQRELTQAYLQAIQTALQETNDALVARVKTGDAVRARDRQVDALREVARISRLRYEGGQATLLDVLDSERQVLAAMNQQAQGRREQYTALVSVYKAMGGGWMLEQDKLRGRVDPSQVPPPPATPAPRESEMP